MKKFLPLAIPPITSYPGVYLLWSILGNAASVTEQWLCDHFIQLVLIKDWDYGRLFGDFYEDVKADEAPEEMNCPFFRTQVINRTELFGVENDITVFLKHYIMHDNYIYLFLNHYFMPFAPSYKKSHYLHQTFISGFDEDNKTFRVSDFYGGKYSFHDIDEDDLNASFFCDRDNKAGRFGLTTQIQEIKLIKYQPTDYQLDINLLKIFLSDYMNGRDTFVKYPHHSFLREHKLIYGIDYYDALCENSDPQDLDIRAYHVLYDHKLAMRIRLQVLEKIGVVDKKAYIKLSQICEELIQSSLNLRNYAMKVSISNRSEEILRLHARCCHLKEQDESFVKLFLESV